MSVQNSFLLKYTKRSPLVTKNECPVCKKQFSLSAVLAKHLKSQHGVSKEGTSAQSNNKPKFKKNLSNKLSGKEKEKQKIVEEELSETANNVDIDSDEENAEGSVSSRKKPNQSKAAVKNVGKQVKQSNRIVGKNNVKAKNESNDQKLRGTENNTPNKQNERRKIFTKSRITSDETESDSQTEFGERRPRRNRREKRAWSPSNDNRTLLESPIKKEPIEYVEQVVVKNFICEICDKSFTSKTGLSRHLKVHQETPVDSVAEEIQEEISSGKDTEESIDNSESKKEVKNESEVPKIKRKRGRARKNKYYPCESCPKVFTKPSHLLRHRVKHTGERPWPCDVCGKGFVSKSNMEKHKVLHTGLKKEVCDECGKAFALESYLVRHKLLHQKERNELMGIKEEPEHHLCAHCGKVFSKANYLRRHMERHIKGKCYECRICGKKFSQRMNRINHEFLHSKTKDYECHICHKKFALKCYLKIHVQRHVNAINNPDVKRKRRKLEQGETKEKPYKCDQCFKAYTSIKYLQAHEKFHSDPKKFVCEVCGRKFHQKINLQRHMLTHTDPVNSKNHECVHCGKKYSRDIYLDRHIKENHTPEGLAKPRHQCEYCEKSFNKPCLLRLHQRTHTKEKPFVCSTCGKGFAQEGYMKIHEEIHSDVKKHECTFCGKTFALLYYLTRHLARHEQTKSIGCDQCPKMFASPKALYDHQRLHTGDLPFKCELCDKSFPRANSLQRHKKLNACQNMKGVPVRGIYYRRPATLTTQEEYIEKQEVSCLYICSICRQVFTSQTKLDAHAAEHEQGTEIITQEEEIPQEAIPVSKEEETIIAEVVNVEESLLGGEEITTMTTEETIVDADWLNRLFENAHVESGTDGKIIIVVNRE